VTLLDSRGQRPRPHTSHFILSQGRICGVNMIKGGADRIEQLAL
jgi:hypothetical protein